MAALTAAGTVLAVTPVAAAAQPKGHDVSSHQKDVDWQSARAKGARFVYVKATESHTYRNPYFGRQYDGARDAGILRGAYHFAVPDKSSGTTQAAYFVRNGGAWRADGWTLPPALDMEYNPYDKKRKCYGLSKARIVSWIQAFSDETPTADRPPSRHLHDHPLVEHLHRRQRRLRREPRPLARPLRLGGHARCRPAGRRGRSGSTTTAARSRVMNLFNGSMTRLKQFAAG